MEQNIWRKSRGFNLSECKIFLQRNCPLASGVAFIPLESWTLVLAPASISMLIMSSFPTHAAKDKTCSPVRQGYKNTVNLSPFYRVDHSFNDL